MTSHVYPVATVTTPWGETIVTDGPSVPAWAWINAGARRDYKTAHRGAVLEPLGYTSDSRGWTVRWALRPTD